MRAPLPRQSFRQRVSGPGRFGTDAAGGCDPGADRSGEEEHAASKANRTTLLRIMFSPGRPPYREMTSLYE